MPVKRKSEASWEASRNRWRVTVGRDGIRRSFYSSIPGRRGKHEAENKADVWLASRIDSSAVRFNAAWEAYEKRLKEATGTGNQKQVEYVGRMYIKPNIPNMYIADITPALWQRCIDAAVRKGLARRTCQDVRGVINGFVHFCHRQRWDIDRLERGELTIPVTTHVGRRKVLQPSDLQLLFAEDSYVRYGHKVQAFYIYAWRLLVVAGLRRGELCGLKWADVKGDRLEICRSVNKFNELTGGKNDNARRDVALSRHARALLDAQREMLRKRGIVSPWIFPDEKSGGRLRSNTIYQRWAVYRKQHGLRGSLHEIRHTFISAVKADLPEPLLKAMVGHSEDMDTYGVYAHEIDGDLQQTAAIVDAVFDRLIGS